MRTTRNIDNDLFATVQTVSRFERKSSCRSGEAQIPDREGEHLTVG